VYHLKNLLIEWSSLSANTFSTLKVINSRIYNWISPDLPSDYLAEIEGAPIGPKAGSCGTAAFIKSNVIKANSIRGIIYAYD
jgi:hypothetical protein